MDLKSENSKLIRSLERKIIDSFKIVRQDILRLNRKVNKLKKELDSANQNSQIVEVQNKISSINKKLGDYKKLTFRLNSLFKELGELEDKVSENSKTVQNNKKVLEKLKDKFYYLKKTFVTRRDLNTKLNSLKERVEEASASIEDLESSIGEIDVLKSKIKQIESFVEDVQDNNALIKKLDRKINRVKSEFKKLNSEREEEINEISEELDELKETSLSKKEFKSKEKLILEDLNKLSSETESLKNKIPLFATNKYVLKVKSELQNDILDKETLIKSNKSRIDKLNKKLNNLIKNLEDKDKEIQTLKSELSRIKKFKLIKAREKPAPHKNWKSDSELKRPSKKAYLWIFLSALAVLFFFILFNYPKLYAHTPILDKITNETLSANSNYLNMSSQIFAKNVSLKTMNENCVLDYECKRAEENNYWFDCYYNPKDQQCHCYEGQFGQCRLNLVNKIKKERETKFDKFKAAFKKDCKKFMDKISYIWSSTINFVLTHRVKVVTFLVVLLVVLVLFYIKESVNEEYIEIVVDDKKKGKKQ